VLVGVLMLVVPHQFASSAYATLPPHLTWLGTWFTLAGGMLLGVAVLGAAAPPAADAASAALKSPSALAIGRSGTAIRDAVLATAGVRRLQAARDYWGGTYTAFTGETVVIHVSTTYPQDDARAQRWADFLAGLIHGSELSGLTAYLAPLDEVQQICGDQALACYSSRLQLLVSPGDDPAVDTSAEAVITHEYGHHVAANRANPPWSALTYGTKRWASYEQVCRRTAAGELHPGAEDTIAYAYNPGEAFAESYRVLNERRANVPEAPWDIVTRALYPDETALSLLEQDVRSPWTADRASSRAGTFARRGSAVRTYSLTTPLDGSFSAVLRVPRTLAATVTISTGSNRVARGATSGGAALVGATLCGTRAVRVTVTRTGGRGAFRLAVETP
jgi:hypothetical protein